MSELRQYVETGISLSGQKIFIQTSGDYKTDMAVIKKLKQIIVEFYPLLAKGKELPNEFRN